MLNGINGMINEGNNLLQKLVGSGLFFSCQIGDYGSETFNVVDFTLEEGLSQLFNLTLTVVSLRQDIDLDDLLLEKASLTVTANGVSQRTVTGIIAGAEQGNSGFRRTYYTFVIRPELWQLTLNQDSRIYHQSTVPQILEEILQQFRIKADCQIMEAHPVHEYITMKRESSYDFFARVAAEEGIVFWFEEDKLFYSDSHLGKTAALPVAYNPHVKSVTQGDIIHNWRMGSYLRPEAVIYKDYDYHKPRYPLMPQVKMKDLEQGDKTPFTVFESYGRFQNDQDGKALAKYRLEQLRSDSKSGRAESNSFKLTPGKIFTLMSHPVAAMNERWQVVTAVHHGKQPQALEEESDGSGTTLNNEVSFVPGREEWRPPFIPKPTADGDEVATVVGPANEEIYVNQDGCVRIHFHWNRYDNADDTASCWVRVAQGWSGTGYGFMAIPRIGQEVIVSYLNGDIDRPIITGCAYNGVNRPPLNLPAHKTRTTFRTQTHKGEGFNELRFEDEAGKEEIFIHAQKNMDLQVRNSKNERVDYNRSTSIGNNEELAITNNRVVTVGGQQDQKTTGNYLELISGDKNLSVEGDMVEKITGTAGLGASGEIILQSDQKITLKVGGSFIVIHPGGVDIKGPSINLNSGTPSDVALPANPSILKIAAASGTPFVAHCPLKQQQESA